MLKKVLVIVTALALAIPVFSATAQSPSHVFSVCHDNGTCTAVAVGQPGEDLGDAMRRVHSSFFNVRLSAAFVSNQYTDHWEGRSYCSLIPRRTAEANWTVTGSGLSLDTPVEGQYVSITFRPC